LIKGSLRIFLSCIILFQLLSVVAVNAASTNFSDVSSNYWASSAIQEAYSNGIVNGYSDKTFRPNKEVNQAEFLQMLYNTYKEQFEDYNSYADLSWYERLYKVVHTALPYVTLQEGNPTQNKYTRGDLAVTVYEAVNDSRASEYTAVNYLLTEGLSSGKTSATYDGYKPGDTLTRAEAVVFLSKLQTFIDSKFDGVLVSGYSPKTSSTEAQETPSSNVNTDDDVFGEFPYGETRSGGSNAAAPIIDTFYKAKLNNISIGTSVADVISTFGEPDNKLKTNRPYIWYTYNDLNGAYLRYGIADDQVVSIFTNSIGVLSKNTGLEINKDTRATILQKFGDNGYSGYLYQTDELRIHLYYDRHAHSDHLLDAVLISEVFADKYIEVGDFFNNELYFDDEIDASHAIGVFELTNSFRAKYGLSKLEYHEAASIVAKAHSVDMRINNYVGHSDSQGLSPNDRLTNYGITFISVGENAAGGYQDDMLVMNGWVNSLGHRQNMLIPSHTHLGVGASERYYTQKFMEL